MLVARPEPPAPIDRVLVRADPAGSLTLFVRALRARISWCVVCADRHAHMHDRMLIGCASSCWFSIGGYESKPICGMCFQYVYPRLTGQLICMVVNWLHFPTRKVVSNSFLPSHILNSIPHTMHYIRKNVFLHDHIHGLLKTT